MRLMFTAFALTSALLVVTPAMAQNASTMVGPEDTEKVKQVFVYGDDPCPKGADDEIVVCARMPDKDRYRIPKELRGDPNAAVNQAWAKRARSIETVGASGINSCSTAGAGGFTGCFAKLAREAKEERKAMLGSATWADAVAKERAKRLGTIDADSVAIEAREKAEEADAEREAKAAAEARARLEAADKAAQAKDAIKP